MKQNTSLASEWMPQLNESECWETMHQNRPLSSADYILPTKGEEGEDEEGWDEEKRGSG